MLKAKATYNRVRTLINCGHYLAVAGNSIVRDVVVVCQRVKTRARSSLVVFARRLESVLARNIDWFIPVDEKAFFFLEGFHGFNRSAQRLWRCCREVGGRKSGEGIARKGEEWKKRDCQKLHD
jgi:hypothetical protein